MKSRVKGDFHARFRENAMVKVHGVTRLGAVLENKIAYLRRTKSNKINQQGDENV